MLSFKLISKRDEYLNRKGINEEIIKDVREQFAALKKSGDEYLLITCDDAAESKIAKVAAGEVATEMKMRDKLRMKKIAGENVLRISFSSSKKRIYKARKKEEKVEQ